MSGRRRGVVRWCVAAVVAGLATFGVAVQAEEASREATADDGVEVLRERAAEFWAARLAGDFRAQWELLEPRVKGRLGPDEFAAGRGRLRYLGYQVEGATVRGLFGTVRVRVLAQPAALTLVLRGRQVPQAAVLDDPWIRVGGVWYRRLDSGGSETPPAENP